LAPPRISNDDGVALVAPGQAVRYAITVVNPGGGAVNAARVTAAFPAEVEGLTWTCAGTGGATCAPSGVGAIADTVDLPAGGRLVYQATGTVASTASGTISSTASLALAGAPAGRAVTDVDVVQGALSYFTLAPCRLVDTRVPGGAVGGPALVGLE